MSKELLSEDQPDQNNYQCQSFIGPVAGKPAEEFVHGARDNHCALQII